MLKTNDTLRQAKSGGGWDGFFFYKNAFCKTLLAEIAHTFYINIKFLIFSIIIEEDFNKY